MIGSLANHIDFNAKMNSNNWCCHRDCCNQLDTLHFHYTPAHMPDALELIYDDSGMTRVDPTQERVPNFLHSYAPCDPCYYDDEFDAATKGMARLHFCAERPVSKEIEAIGIKYKGIDPSKHIRPQIVSAAPKTSACAWASHHARCVKQYQPTPLPG